MSLQLKLETLNQDEFNNIVDNLKDGGIGVIPTDTIYGIVGSALKEKTVEKIYDLRKRAKDKPMIILISELKDLELFHIDLNLHLKDFLYSIWPNKVSVVLPCLDAKFSYLHRGKLSLAFRSPKNDFLEKLLSFTGPLVAPSANHEGETPAHSITEAMYYFANEVNFYLDGGILQDEASTVIEIIDGKINIIRQGDYQLENLSL